VVEEVIVVSFRQPLGRAERATDTFETWQIESQV